MALADSFDGFLVDLDGVVWLGREAIPGSAETLAALIAAGKRLVFVTNNPGRRPAAYAERLRELGVEVGEEQIVTAGMVAARLAAAAAPGDSAFVIGATTLKEMTAAAGLELLEGEAAREAGVVLVSGHRGFDYEELLTATLALAEGAALVATSRDPTMPMPGGEWPGTGAVLAAVETASGRSAEIGGKPERHLFELALAALGLDHRSRGSSLPHEGQKEPQLGVGAVDAGDGVASPGRVAMVGDRIASDVEGGRRAGLATILALTGSSSRAAAEAADPGPDHVVDDLPGLLQ
jgi:glycerol 3-phosphatase-2